MLRLPKPEFPQPIDEKRRDELIEAIAKRVKQFGMTVPAIFFLEMNKPISYLGSQAMHFFAPLVGVFFNTFDDYAYFFEDRRNVELLIQRLEAMALEEQEEERRAKELRKQEKEKRRQMVEEARRMRQHAQGGTGEEKK
ncbi:MAG TPA: hypothetical protein GX510_01630 [Firmicutes bacterium]|nr:hypothetical protein [Candidatus Fermentithermobacillaceae bacterium]